MQSSYVHIQRMLVKPDGTDAASICAHYIGFIIIANHADGLGAEFQVVQDILIEVE